MFFPKKNKQRVFFGKRCQRNIPEVCFPEPRPLDELSSLSKWLQEVIGGLGSGGWESEGSWVEVGVKRWLILMFFFIYLICIYIYMVCNYFMI